MVDFEWDEDKSNRCFEEGGFDFAYAIRAFLDPERDVLVDDRWEYGESRYILRGPLKAACLSWFLPIVKGVSGSFRPERQTEGR